VDELGSLLCKSRGTVKDCVRNVYSVCVDNIGNVLFLFLFLCLASLNGGFFLNVFPTIILAVQDTLFVQQPFYVDRK